MSEYVIGIDLGGTNIKAGLLNADTAKVINSQSIKTESQKGSDDTFYRIANLVDRILENEKIDKKDVLGIGLGIPGPVINNEIVSFFANFPWEKNLNVAKELGAKTGLKVKLDNDVNVITMGEAWAGAAKGYKNVLGLAIGTGIGGGIIANGQLMSGMSGGAGEVGHMKIIEDGKLCGCGMNGCWEAYASATGIEREARSRLTVNKANLLWDKIDGKLEKLETKDIFDAAKEGDEFSKDLVDYAVKHLSLGIANLLNVLNPEIVVIGGGVSLAGDILFDALKERIKKDTLSVNLENIKIVPAELGNDAGVVGAGALLKNL